MAFLVLLLYLLGLLVIIGVTYFFFASFLYGAGYQATPREVAFRMLEVGEVGAGDRVYDLGAGTGRLLFMAAEDRGATVTGIEVEVLRYLALRLRRWRSPARSRIHLQWADFFTADLSPATVVMAFLWPGAMARLKSKLEKELAPGTRVVSYWHPVPGWVPVTVDVRRRTYLYRGPPFAAAQAPRTA